jgi:hypothetical protein
MRHGEGDELLRDRREGAVGEDGSAERLESVVSPGRELLSPGRELRRACRKQVIGHVGTSVQDASSALPETPLRMAFDAREQAMNMWASS